MVFYIIQASYFLATLLFIVGLRQMSGPRTAARGIQWAGWGMLLAIAMTAFAPTIQGSMNSLLMIVAVVLGTIIACYSGTRVEMTAMPQMIALYNGMGGGAAAAIAAIEWLDQPAFSWINMALILLSAVIGMVSLSGSLIAFAKLQGWLKRHFSGKTVLNGLLSLGTLASLISCVLFPQSSMCLAALFSLLFVLGITLTLPIGGANMPVVISLFNAMTGLAVGLEGFALNNAAMMVAGTVVGAAGTLLTQLMAKAMNQSLLSILWVSNGSGASSSEQAQTGSLKSMEVSDAAVSLAFAERVIIVPGYGMAVAQAQHKVWELAQLLGNRQVTVKFAIHPVAGRMPGHMNVLLAEAGVPYELISDLDEINAEFAIADLALIIGANDVVNPVAKTDPNSPIYGMPILNANQAKQVLVIKRGRGAGFSGIENALFYDDKTYMLFGDGQSVAAQLVQAIKSV